jgi:hypothetical protein
MVALIACSDDSGSKDDTGVKLDGGSDSLTPDTGITPLDTGVRPDTMPACDKTKLGIKCTQSNPQVCGTGNTCLLYSQTEGICSCACTPDDSSTSLIDEDTCPNKPNYICGTLRESKKSYCLKICKPKYGASDCPTGMRCAPNSSYYAGLFGKAVCLLAGCTQNSDCSDTTGKRCDTSKTDCATNETCLPFVSGGTKGICAKPGTCDVKSGLCKPGGAKTGAKIGDPCLGDTDCGTNQECLIGYDEQTDLGRKPGGSSCTQDTDCCSGSCGTSGTCDKGLCVYYFRNGYCTKIGCKHAATLTEAKCDTGSYCNQQFYGGYCQKTCDLTKKDTCRNNTSDYLGDYECRQWNNLILTSTGKAVTTGPVCDFGFVMGCNAFGSSSTLSCYFLGTDKTGKTAGTTNMVCRDLSNNKLSNQKDPMGLCLDDTASGAVKK